MGVRHGVRRAGLVGVIGTLALVVGPTFGPIGSAGAVEDTYQCNLEDSQPVAFTVPAGVTSVSIQAFGAQGGTVSGFGPDLPGGEGGSVQATMPVTAGDKLYLLVGCSGQAPVNNDAVGAAAVDQPGGGGAGGNSGGASGGGASVVMLNGTAASNVVVVAGGGGGAGTGAPGGAGSGTELAVPGQDSTPVIPYGNSTGGGGGGTAACSTGPEFGAGQGSEDGGPCASYPNPGGVGGGTSGNTFAGGGGGGGWQSGGGGGGGCGDCGVEGAGGGGGSGIVRSPAVEAPASTPTALRASAIGGNTGNGRVILTYTVTPTVTPTPAPAPAVSPRDIRFTG